MRSRFSPLWPLIGIMAFLLCIPVGFALPNALFEMPVVVRPLNGYGVLQPNTTFSYNFVFSQSPACAAPLLNLTKTMVTDAYGVASADLNLSDLATVPSYLCEYKFGALRKVHLLNQNLFLNFTSGNASWNQGLASTLFAPSSLAPDNQSWNETRANARYAPITSGNASWNQTLANTLYYAAANPSGFITDGNTNWENNYGYVTSGEVSGSYLALSGGSITGDVVITGNLAIIGSYLNATVTNTVYNGSITASFPGIFDIGSDTTPFRNITAASFNGGWNNSVLYTTTAQGDVRWLSLGDQRYNETAQLALINTTENVKGLGFNTTAEYEARYCRADGTNCPASGGDNASWNQSLATTLYAPFSTTSDNRSWNETRATALYAPITLVADNTSWNETRANTLYPMITAVTNLQTANTTLNASVLTLNTKASNLEIANGTLNSSLTSARTAIADLQSANTTLNGSLTNARTAVADLQLANGTLNSSLTNVRAGILQLNTTANIRVLGFNTTSDYDARYALVSVTGDNASWNQTFANSLYASILLVGDNQSWNETRTNALYLLAGGTAANTNQLGGQVATYFLNSTGGTYENRSWNETRASALYAPIGVTGDNASWNETRANTLYAPFSLAADNASWNETRANAIYYLQAAGSLDNKTWNQTLASLLYAPITGSNQSWNQTLADVLYARNASIPTCLGTDKLTSTGNGILSCASDQTTAGGGTTTLPASNITNGTFGSQYGSGNYLFPANLSIAGLLNVTGDLSEFNGVRTIHSQSYFCDEVSVVATTMCNPHYLGAAVASGTEAAGTGTRQQPGILTLARAAGTNSGWQQTTGVTSFLMNGSETFTMSAGAHVAQAVNNVSLFRLGFIDTVTQTTPVDGLYFEYSMNLTNSTGNCFAANNSVRFNTSTANFTITSGASVWYEFGIQVNATGTGARCVILNATDGTLLWNGTVSQYLPTQAGRETGSGFIALGVGAGAANTLFSVDYLDTEIQQRRRWLN